MLLMFILGCFVLPSLTEGDTMKTFTCSSGRLTVTCDAGKVILIKQVRRGSYNGAFNGSHCKYQVGDSTEVDDGNSKDVWENCNLQSRCSVLFSQSGNIYLEMECECVYKHTIDMLDICDTGNGTRLVAKHGYIHSPCYPNLSTWNESTHVYCQCSGTFQFPEQTEMITISIFNAFQDTESMEIRWYSVNNPAENIKKDQSSYKVLHTSTGSFYLKFSSSYRGSDWNRGFWLEFTANGTFEFKCSNAPRGGQVLVTPPTCQAPPPTTTSPTTTTPTTTTQTTSTATMPTTTTPNPIAISSSVNKSNIDMLDICDTGSGTRLVAKHGYIHSPCYPNLSTWNASTYVYCQCSGTLQFPVKSEAITTSVFHAFQETETLEIRWHAITNPPQKITNNSSSFKTEMHKTSSFYLKFYSSYRGSDWDRGFWLEFTANSLLEFKCSNTPIEGQLLVIPPTCQPSPSTTIPITSTTTPTTTTATTATTTTLMTTAGPASTTTSILEGSLPNVKTTIPVAITTSNSSPTNASSNEVDGSQSNEQDVNIPAIVGLAVPLIIVSAILTSLIIFLWRNGIIARLCKGHSNKNANDIAQTNADCGPVYENVLKEHVSRSNFDPEFVGDQNPRLTQSSDMANYSSHLNVPANLTHSHNQMMPTYENIEHGRNPGARNLDTDTRVPSGEDCSPYEEVGDTGARMPGDGTAAVSGEETESPYARLDPVEHSEYLDLRRLGFAHQSPSK